MIQVLSIHIITVKTAICDKHFRFTLQCQLRGKYYTRYALLEPVRHLALDDGSRGTTAHAHQCCKFQSYAKTVAKLTISELCEDCTEIDYA